ncbi:coenzyme F420:L-glutamate ligase [mine drainage metagenome]|uniref:Coenzyme F420:L-glutamate ligase n=1 Tax=mine drainage metagenome TaxID=410659 RepID=A0A1J5SLE8_9ZZZZ
MLSALESMHARRSIREFEPELVPADTIRQVVEAAGHAPSSKNTQPWRLYLVQGTALEALVADYLAAFDAGRAPKPAYRYSPDPLPDTWMARARAVGYGIFQHKGIAREDKEKRRQHDRENFRFFGAPHVFFIGTQESAYSYGTFLDCGFVFDNLMLGLVSLGLGSCPQFSAVAYPDLLRKHIPGSEDTLFIAGLAFGRPKADSHVNAFQPPRLPVEEWFKVVG